MAARRSAFFSILVLTLTVLLAACGGGANGHATSTALPSTGTPPAPKIMSLDEASAAYHGQVYVQATLRAISAGSVDALLDLVDWQDTPCGNPHGEGMCPTGQPGATVRTVFAGFADTFELREDTLRQALERLFGGGRLSLTFVAQTREPYMARKGGIAGPVFLVGLEGAPRSVDISISGMPGVVTGIFLELEAYSPDPIIEIGSLDERWTATQQGLQFAHDLDWFALAPPFDRIPNTAKPPSFATFEALYGTPSRGGSRIVLEPAVCAAGSNEPFLAVQREVEFAIYCPTYLPDGFTMKRVSLDPPKSGTPTFLTAVFAQPDGTEIDFWQFIPGNDVFPQWRQYGPPARVGPVAYGGDFLATLWDVWTAPSQPKSAVVWGVAPDGRYHVISGNSATLDADTMRRIAEGMVRLGPLGTPPP
jgi:hypothetical protein